MYIMSSKTSTAQQCYELCWKNSCKQYTTKIQLCGYRPPISKTIQINKDNMQDPAEEVKTDS